MSLLKKESKANPALPVEFYSYRFFIAMIFLFLILITDDTSVDAQDFKDTLPEYTEILPYTNHMHSAFYSEGGGGVENGYVAQADQLRFYLERKSFQLTPADILSPEGTNLGNGEIRILNASSLEAHSDLRRIFITNAGGESIPERALQYLGHEREISRELMAADNRYFAVGEWVDRYLDIVRRNSWGTTLAVRTEHGRIIGFVPALHSSLFEENRDYLYTTAMEEVVQSAVYTSYMNQLRKMDPAEDTDRRIVEAITSGNERAFLEYIQHKTLHEVYPGWNFFPYDIQIHGHAPSKLIATTASNLDTVSDVMGLEGDLAQNFTASRLTLWNQLSKATYNTEVWNLFGMEREGFRIFPAVETSRREVSYIRGDFEFANESSSMMIDTELVSVGDTVYMRALKDTLIHTYDANGNRRQPLKNIVVEENQVVRAQIREEGIAEILPDNDSRNGYGNGYQDVFVDVQDFAFIEDLRPLNVFESTPNHAKTIVVVKGDDPQLLLVEGGQIVMRVPAVLGSFQPTPNGDHRVSYLRTSRHMPTVAGVGFVGYFGNGMAIHDSPWWNWQNDDGTKGIDQGFWGSHGCINLPSNEWHGVVLSDGTRVSIAEFVYRWMGTNLALENYADESARISWDEDGFSEGSGSVRLLIVRDVRDILNYTQNEVTDFNAVIDQFQSTEALLLPSF